MTTSESSLGLDIDVDSSITSLSVSNITPVAIATDKTLSGSITVSAGSLNLTETGTLASAITMSGGKLDADASMVISGAVTQAGNAAIDVEDEKTVTFNTGTINTENYQLTFEGEGTVAFPTDSSGIVLNHEDGIVKLDGTGTVQAVQVSTAANAGKGILVTKSGEISNLKISADTELNISNGKTLYGSTEVTANKTLSLSGTGTCLLYTSPSPRD